MLINIEKVSNKEGESFKQVAKRLSAFAQLAVDIDNQLYEEGNEELACVFREVFRDFIISELKESMSGK